MEELLKSLEEMLKLRIMAYAVNSYPKRFTEIENKFYDMGIGMGHDELYGFKNGLGWGIKNIMNIIRNTNDVALNEKMNDLLYVTLPEYEKSVYSV